MNFSSLNATAINGPARSVVLAFVSILAAGSVAASAAFIYSGSVSADVGGALVAQATRYVVPVTQVYASATTSSEADRTAFVSADVEPHAETTASAVITAFGAVGFETTAHVDIYPYKVFVGAIGHAGCTATVAAEATRILVGDVQLLSSSAHLSPFASYFTGYSFSSVQCAATLSANANQENIASASATAVCTTTCASTAYRFVGADLDTAAFALAYGDVYRLAHASALGEANVQPSPYQTMFAGSVAESPATVLAYGSVIYKTWVYLDGRASFGAIPDVTIRYAQAAPGAGCAVTVHRLIVNPLANDPNGKVFYRASNGFVKLYSGGKSVGIYSGGKLVEFYSGGESVGFYPGGKSVEFYSGGKSVEFYSGGKSVDLRRAA